MRKILTLFMSGLVTVLPLALTIYVIWWLVHTVEGWLRRALIALGIVSPAHYWPGLGLIAGFVLPETTTTVLQDWTKGRRSEVDDLNGLVANRLELAGKSAPINRAIVQMAHQIERRQAAPGVQNMPNLLDQARRGQSHVGQFEPAAPGEPRSKSFAH